MADQSLTWWMAMVGGIGGAILGCLGGLLGCYCSIRNTNGPRERTLMVRASALCLLGVALFLATLWATPSPWRPLVLLPYLVALPWVIRTINRKQVKIRLQEAEASL